MSSENENMATSARPSSVPKLGVEALEAEAEAGIGIGIVRKGHISALFVRH